MTRLPFKRLGPCIAAAMLCMTMAGPAHATPPACDPYAHDNDLARDARIHHNIPLALKLAAKVLDQQPNDFRANYTAGLALLEQSGFGHSLNPDFNLVRDGTKRLANAAPLLEKLDPICAKYARDNDWYSILNALAAGYYATGDKSTAEQFLQRAYAKRALLKPTSRQKLLDNMGLFYFELKNYGQSARYYNEAGQAGSAGADQRAATAQQLGELLTTRHGK